MINLLPDEAKRQISAARTNVTLVKYIFFLGLAAIFLAAACAFVYFFLINSKAAAEELIRNSNSNSTSYASVQNQANLLRNNLATAKGILDQEIVYSDIVTGIASVLPSGVVLDTLTLSNTTFGTPLKLQAHARTTEDALKLKDNFQKSPLFSNFTLESLSNSESNNTGYPVTVSISVIINRGATR